ncbi:Acyl-CoA dehydrogenase apdG (Aspyridones biosynthesis protein G) [Durusdinium trenchii]|uniref:Acyl-CoA dehydrogenase apdG (Aspyridones biosynthesis protein G) n=1 Tax=Durusdinium trenchii TaxID=1381693 RepID=A0ABP0SFX2_9DINO
MAAAAEYTEADVAKHNQNGDCWLIIEGAVYDVSKFMAFHPGSTGIIERVAGTDCTTEFFSLHREEVLEKYERLKIGQVKGVAPKAKKDKGALSKVPYAEWTSPFWTDKHHKVKRAAREFVEREIMPFVDEWEKKQAYPDELVETLAAEGYIAAALGPGPHLKLVPKLPGGVAPEDFDYFCEQIVSQEMKRTGAWALLDGLSGGTVIGAPPVMRFGSEEVRNKVVPEILSGKKRICLAITDPYAGSDVANTTCTATLSADGSHYIVKGVKKWITGGMKADYFTTLVRTGDKGHGGVSMLLIAREHGVETESIKTSYSSVAGTSFVTYDAKVPVGNLLGKEGMGFMVAMSNFNHERVAMAWGGLAQNRLVIEECFKWAYTRRVFGKRLIHQPQIQEKLAEMIAFNESAQAWSDIVTHRMNNLSYKDQNIQLAGTISMLKNQQVEASRVINEHAMQIFGGRGLTATGMGKKLENFQRTFQYGSILGGANSVLATQAIRHALKFMPADARL